MEFYKRGISPKKGDHEFGKKIGISKELRKLRTFQENQKEEPGKQRNRMEFYKTMSNPKIKLTITKFESKNLSNSVNIELIGEITTSNSPLAVVNCNSNQKINIKANTPDGSLQNYVKPPKQQVTNPKIETKNISYV